MTSATDGNSNVPSINGTWTYGYAAHFAHRLGTATCTANCPAQYSPFNYSYDEFGDRWGTISNVQQYSFDGKNHINNNGVSYDVAGDMTADGLGNSYYYDAEGRLISGTLGGSSFAATYDAFGNRVETIASNGTNDYIFGLNGRVLHYNTSTTKGLGEDVYVGDQHVGLYASGTFYMVHEDQVGSTRRWTVHNPSNGTWSSQETVTNLPWGDATTNSSGAPLSDHDFFADFIQDQDGEFQSMTRRYSAVQGRWTTPDPAGQAAVDPANPQTWNRYAYVINNPVGLTDPSGLCTLRSLCQALVGMFDTNCPIWAGGACPPALPGWDEFDLMEIPVVGGGAGSGSQSVTSYDYQYVPGSFSLMQNFDSEGNPILDASGNSTYTIQETTGGWQLIGANLSPPTTSGGGGILFWLQGFAANNGTPNPNTPVVQQDNGKSKPNVPPEWGFCSGYRDGTGAGDAMYHLCMSFPNGPWSNCVRGKLLNQWTPNPNPFQLVWYLGPDHAYDFATCAIQ